MNPDLLLRAATILEREAVVLAVSYTVPGADGTPTWPDLNADAHEDYDEMVAVAAELRKVAA